MLRKKPPSISGPRLTLVLAIGGGMKLARSIARLMVVRRFERLIVDHGAMIPLTYDCVRK